MLPRLNRRDRLDRRAPPQYGQTADGVPTGIPRITMAAGARARSQADDTSAVGESRAIPSLKYDCAEERLRLHLVSKRFPKKRQRRLRSAPVIDGARRPK